VTLLSKCPTNGTEIAFGFPVYAAEQAQPPVARGEVRGTQLPGGEVSVYVTECPACGRVHQLVVQADAS
jgi:hypothetical protein